ncbi:MAG: bacillithiol biosynthesis deacetylase BshB1 [Bacteroidetes bacterium]|nr:bacillithiol biosynthesis deacetylase BshB1 [Bacteroidota bacterium]
MEADVLAIGAHPDDLELGCGGTLAKLVRQGYNVVLCDLTQGELGTRGTKEIRMKEASKAAEILGVAHRYNLMLPDGNVEVSKKNIEKLVTLIREVRPSLLIIPYGVERHPDHVHTNQLSKEAWYYSGLAKLLTKHNGKEQKRHRPHHYFEFLQWYEFEPSFIVDITDTFEIKMEAVRSYASQFYNPQNKEPETKLSRPDFLEIIETRCRYYGAKIGVKYGEPFISPFSLGVENLFDLKIIPG